MLKKVISIIICATVVLSVVGCGKSNEKSEDKNKAKIVKEEKYDELTGKWAEDTTLDALKENFKSLLSKVEEKTKGYGLNYSKEEAVKEENGITVNKNYLYLDNEKPEKNRLESLYFGMYTFGEDLSSGQITMKLSLNFDGEKAKKEGKYDFGATSLASYAEILTEEKNRDYSEMNTKIIDILNSESGEGIISDSVNGLYEEFVVNKDYIVYKLETKKYDFSKLDENATK